ncbi:MAG: hypothetical protein ACRYGO_19540 [Janthinobacterium lividum]
MPTAATTMYLRLACALQFLLCMAIALPASATEPLHDQIVVDARQGTIHPEKCCWVELPFSETLRKMKREEFLRCSAIGGPVGVFELKDRKIWLNKLSRCGGDVALREIYPDMDSPAFAGWLSGSFKTQLGYLCYVKPEGAVYELEQELKVEHGVVTSLSERRRDRSACPPEPPLE